MSEGNSAPKAFISHASEDKPTYAEPLARELRALGIDAWLDRWELRPGDDLVQKVFDEGLGGSATVLFVMTPTSIQKPWVRAELSNAVSRHVEGKLRLIPILAENCDVPQAVLSLLWIDWEKEGGASAVAGRIASTIFQQTEKPPLGARPNYLQEVSFNLPGLSKTDAVVLAMLYECAIEEGSPNFRQLAEIEDAAKVKGITTDDLLESAEMLASNGYVFGDQYGVEVLGIPPSVFLGIAQKYGIDVDLTRKRFVAAILNEGMSEVWSIADKLEEPRAVCEAIADDLENRSLISQARPLSGSSIVLSPTVALRRWLRDQP